MASTHHPLTAMDSAPSSARDQEVARYITAIEELEAVVVAQEQRIAALTESNTDLERFAYICSHDLQEPLRRIVNYTQRLERHLGKSLDKKGAHYMEYITQGATQARQLIGDVLNYARIGHEHAAPEMIGGDEVAWNVLHDLAELIKESGAQITRDPIPILRMQPMHLRQLLQNLISNALKFSQAAPVIRISVVRDGDYWRFGVHDNGIGIAPQHWEHVFSIFQRLHSRDQYPGTGIGLALCKKVVQAYGGKIWVESMPEKGSSFYFTLPASITESDTMTDTLTRDIHATDIKATPAN